MAERERNHRGAPERDEEALRHIEHLLSVLNTIRFDASSLHQYLEEYQQSHDGLIARYAKADTFWASAQADDIMKTLAFSGSKEDARRDSVSKSIHGSLYIDEMQENARNIKGVRERLAGNVTDGISIMLLELNKTLNQLEDRLPVLEDYYVDYELTLLGLTTDAGIPDDIEDTESLCNTLVASLEEQVYDLCKELYFYQNVTIHLLDA